MTWRRPRWAARLQPKPVADLLAEAHAVGVIGRGAIATPSRRLLAGEPEDVVVAAMNKVLPAPIDHFLLQADLTVVVPGPLDRGSGRTTVGGRHGRVGGRRDGVPDQRAVDPARPRHRPARASELHTLFAQHSKTPVPQGLTYLIDDVARRHGQLRVGMAASFVRCEDPALLAQAIAAPALEKLDVRALAPTVAVSHVADRRRARRAADRGLRARRRGLVGHDRRHPVARRPGADARAGAAATGRRRARRLRRWARSSPCCARWRPRRPTATRLDPAEAMAQLHGAAHRQESVVIGYVDPAGVATQRVVAPINVRGGQLTAYDPAAGRVRDFAIHRVTSVVSADPG